MLTRGWLGFAGREQMLRTEEQKERHALANHKWYLSHKQQTLKHNFSWRQALKLEVFSYYSKSPIPFCLHCGQTDIDVLCLDHICNGGVQQRIRLGNIGGHKFYSRVKKHDFPEGYQVLCANCNLKKAMVFCRNGNSL